MTERQIRLEQVRNQANVSLDVILANNVTLMLPCSDLVTPITPAVNVAYLRSPVAFTLTAASASLLNASNGGNVNIQIHNITQNFDLFANKLQIDNLSTTSLTSNSAVTFTNNPTNINADDCLIYKITAAGANATGLIVKLTGYSFNPVGQ